MEVALRSLFENKFPELDEDAPIAKYRRNPSGIKSSDLLEEFQRYHRGLCQLILLK
jgi:hypothetical protein